MVLEEFLEEAGFGLPLSDEFRFFVEEEGGALVRELAGERGAPEPPAIRLPKPLPNLDAVLAMNLFLGDEQFLADENFGGIGNLVGINNPFHLGLMFLGNAAHRLTSFDLVHESLLRIIV